MATITTSQARSSRVLDTPPADAKTAHEHFLSRLSFETDPSDVYTDLKNMINSIVVVDARTVEAYSKGHVPGAINLPWRTINRETTAELSRDKVLVTYCDGVYCNASTKAAARLTGLGFRVKEMLDGMSGWRREGYPVEESIVRLSSSS
ncbi:MAG TPA: rhodanese-like domain-containing protein [Candidatus Bathyarchaeia archaeon]|nr:rhodanese-like domain-containing protein [Candidatus Bathyarchaeia archaeon]